jgi:hypothetical protein
MIRLEVDKLRLGGLFGQYISQVHTTFSKDTIAYVRTVNAKSGQPHLSAHFDSTLTSGQARIVEPSLEAFNEPDCSCLILERLE